MISFNNLNITRILMLILSEVISIAFNITKPNSRYMQLPGSQDA
jgi:hypothetical protein